jgi:hypothetical protein
MPRSMLRRLPIVACAVALAVPLGLVACGDDEQGIDEPANEGLAIELGGVDYTVFITRELNPEITPDNAYVTDEAPPGEALYGVFLRACNVSDDQREAASEFIVKDNQENTFEPESLPEDNQSSIAVASGPQSPAAATQPATPPRRSCKAASTSRRSSASASRPRAFSR